MKLYELSEYRTDEENEKMKISKEMNDLLDLASEETDLNKQVSYEHYWDDKQVELISVGFFLDNLIQTGQLKNEYLINEIEEVIQFLKNKRSFKNYHPNKKRVKNDIVDSDIRFDKRLDAEKIIWDKEFNLILKDYLQDKYLKDEIIKRVQGILNLIYDYRLKREKKKDRIQELKNELKEEYRRKNIELSKKDANDPYDLEYEFIPPGEVMLKKEVSK